MKREEKFLFMWLEARANISFQTESDLLKIDLFESGIIDSFSVIELIADVEKEFEIRFSELQFQDRRFRSISGIGEIIRESANE